jgi:hypothetical protein
MPSESRTSTCQWCVNAFLTLIFPATLKTTPVFGNTIPGDGQDANAWQAFQESCRF